ncbi:hypothetical protein BKA70DRAFT_1450636 [Coprinopsis sp. MPI-PUGE-AT-0042]|nr:hypothetical protein BKA70DRAFT_1450636 [Coprinopsis sp. MPI-PUGE-AT-0042]
MVTSVRRCPTSSTDKPVGGEASANLDGYAKKEWDKTLPHSAWTTCGSNVASTGNPTCLACLYHRHVYRPLLPMITQWSSFAMLHPPDQATSRLHFIDRIKTLDLFATRHLCPSLKTESTWQ